MLMTITLKDRLRARLLWLANIDSRTGLTT